MVNEDMSSIPSVKNKPVTRPDSGRLLIVDDDPEVLEPLCEFLSMIGYEVQGLTAGNVR